MKLIPESHQDLLKDETRAYAFLATVMADGSPQVTPVWFNTRGEFLLINSAKGRVKDKNMRTRPQIALVIQDPHQPLHYVQVRGRVLTITEQGAFENINALSLKYDRKSWTPRVNETRVSYMILPEKVFADE